MPVRRATAMDAACPDTNDLLPTHTESFSANGERRGPSTHLLVRASVLRGLSDVRL